jgi:hypothetical protein
MSAGTIEVVGTDEDATIAFVWIESRRDEGPDGTAPPEQAARQAIADTAKEQGWTPEHLDPSRMRPIGMRWFKSSAPGDEPAVCEDGDPDREDRFWLFDISDAEAAG